MSEPETHFDGCACVKGDGCWGQDGWHFFRMSAADYVRLYVQRELARRPPTAQTDELRRNLRQIAEIQTPTYAGSMTAYEPCPAYQKAAKAEAVRKKRAQESSGKPPVTRDWSDND